MDKTGLTRTDELVRRAVSGDGSAFTELWDTNIDSLRSYIGSMVKQLDDFYIDDICSRSFEKAFRQIHSFDASKSRFSTWLTAIAHNTALDVLECEKRSSSKMVSIDSPDAPASMIGSIQEEGDSTVLDSIIKDEDEEKMQKLIASLPDLYREVATKRLVEGASYKDIAEETGLELNTVRTRIRRARQMLDKLKNSAEDE